MKKHKLLWIVVAVIIIIVLFLFLRNRGKNEDFETQRITLGDIYSVVEATGQINPKTLVDVGCQVTGRIEEIYVDFNSHVKKGQLLAKIDPATYKAQYEQAKAKTTSSTDNLKALNAKIKESQFNIKKQKAILTDKELYYKRTKALIKKDLIPASTYDKAMAEYLAAAADLEAAKANLETSIANYKKAQADHKSDLAQLDQAEANLSYTDIISPIDGIVISKKVDAGQTVVSTFQTSTLFQIAEDLTEMEIHCDINESDIGNIKKGQKATFTVDAYPGRTFTGRIIQVRDEAKEIEKTVYYTAVIDVKNPGLLLKPGMTAQVEVVTQFKKAVLRISNKALRFLPKSQKLQDKLKELHSRQSSLETEPGQTSAIVWTLKKGEPAPIEIIIGISDNNFTELIKGALKEHGVVITGEKTKKK